MTELEAKIQRLLNTGAINIETKEPGRIKHRATRILPLTNRTEPRSNDFCRTIVIGKD